MVSPFQAHSTDEKSWLREVEQYASAHKAAWPSIKHTGPKWCGPGPAAGLRAKGVGQHCLGRLPIGLGVAVSSQFPLDN